MYSTMFMTIPSLNPFRFARRIKVANSENKVCPVQNPHSLSTFAIYSAMLHMLNTVMNIIAIVKYDIVHICLRCEEAQILCRY